MTKRRFFYLVPAESRYRLVSESLGEYLRRRLFQRTLRRPTGGVKVIYQHCDMLREAGFEAHPVHLGHFKIDWFAHGCEPLSADEALRRMQSGDVLVVPERLPEAAGGFTCNNKIAFVQNGGLVEGALGGKRYEDFGFTGILCCSAYLDRFMTPRSALPRTTVTNGIALERFVPAPQKRRANTVLYLKRKTGWAMGRKVQALLPEQVSRQLNFIELPNTNTEEGMINAYQSADIFMALGFPEGFALPPLEAMACGCAVAGFTGGGGTTHMHDGKTALVVQDGDVKGLAKALSRLVEEPGLKESLRQNGQVMAQNFSMARMRGELLAFAEGI